MLSFGFSAVADSNEELQKLTHAVYFTSHYYVDSVKMSKLVDDAITLCGIGSKSDVGVDARFARLTYHALNH